MNWVKIILLLVVQVAALVVVWGGTYFLLRLDQLRLNSLEISLMVVVLVGAMLGCMVLIYKLAGLNKE